MNQDSANAALVCDFLAFLSTGFASELDLLPRGKQCVLMAVVSTNSPTRNTFDVDVKIAGETTVEGSRAILAAHITIISQWWHLEKKGMIWVHGVLYHVGYIGTRFVKEECAFGYGAFVVGTKYWFLAAQANNFFVQLFYKYQVMSLPQTMYDLHLSRVCWLRAWFMLVEVAFQAFVGGASQYWFFAQPANTFVVSITF